MQIGPVMVNCYLLVNEDDKKVIVVDPGGDAVFVSSRIDELGCKPEAVLLTHGHFDHILGVEDLREKYGLKVYAHEDEKEVLNKPEFNLSVDIGKRISFDADAYVKDGEHINIAGFDIECIHTPGHTPGGVSYYLKEQGILFSGDSLFNQSIGRTDFVNGSASALVSSVKEKLMVLPDEVKVLPGHDQLTTIGFEKEYNPFL